MSRILLLLVPACLWAQAPAALRSLDHLAGRAKESVDVSLDSSTLQFAGKFLSGGKDEAEAKNLIANLKGIFVRSFEFAQEGQYSAADLQPLRAELQKPGWSRILGAQSKTETSEMFSRTESGRSAGFAIIAAEPKELTVVYIDGPIDLNQLGRLGGQFGIPPDKLPGAQKKGTK